MKDNKEFLELKETLSPSLTLVAQIPNFDRNKGYPQVAKEIPYKYIPIYRTSYSDPQWGDADWCDWENLDFSNIVGHLKVPKDDPRTHVMDHEAHKGE